MRHERGGPAHGVRLLDQSFEFDSYLDVQGTSVSSERVDKTHVALETASIS